MLRAPVAADALRVAEHTRERAAAQRSGQRWLIDTEDAPPREARGGAVRPGAHLRVKGERAATHRRCILRQIEATAGGANAVDQLRRWRCRIQSCTSTC